MTGCFQKLLQKNGCGKQRFVFQSDFFQLPCFTEKKKRVIGMPRLICFLIIIWQLATGGKTSK